METRNHSNSVIPKSDTSRGKLKMKKMKKSILPIITFASILLISSCSKQGCIDSTAKNYNSKANSSDNSCIYEENLILWQSESSAQELLSDGITAIKWYIDGQFVGSHAAAEYTTMAPTCSSVASQLNTIISFGSSKTKTIVLEAKDQNNNSLGDDILTLTAGTCQIYEF